MNRVLKIGCGIAVAGLVIVVILVLATGGREGTGQVKTGAPAGETSTPSPRAPAFSSIVSETEGMTDAQRNSYLKKLVGYRVARWTGDVCDVAETFGTYSVEVTVDKGNDEFLCSAEARWKVTEEQALGYAKGQVVTFSGTIERVSELAGSISFTLTDVEIH